MLHRHTDTGTYTLGQLFIPDFIRHDLDYPTRVDDTEYPTSTSILPTPTDPDPGHTQIGAPLRFPGFGRPGRGLSKTPGSGSGGHRFGMIWTTSSEHS